MSMIPTIASLTTLVMILLMPDPTAPTAPQLAKASYGQETTPHSQHMASADQPAAHMATDISGQVRIEKVWARETGGSTRSSAAYFSLTNIGDSDLELIGAESNIAKRVMIHQTNVNKDGIARMMHAHKAVIEKGTSLDFKPGGYHVMLIGLARPLKRGEDFTMTLNFTSGKVEIPVRVMPITGPTWSN